MKLSKILLVLSLVMGLVFMAGSAKAATSAIEGVPGGAGIITWQASAAGLATVVDITNISNGRFDSILVHAIVYDRDSKHIVDFNIPLSPRDHAGLLITGDGTNITISNLEPTPEFPIPILPVTVAVPAIDDLQHGYMTFTITASDNAGFGGDGNGDPTNDPNLTGTTRVLPDWLIVRYALVDTNTQSHVDINAIMFQGFLNIPTLNEIGGFVDTTPAAAANAAVNYDWNNDGNPNTFTGADDGNGIAIDPWELFATENIVPGVIADDTDGDGVPETLYNTLGSANRNYWARWNNNPDLPISSTLVTVFPCSNTTNWPTAGRIQSVRNMTLLSYNEDEDSVSTGLNPPEVGLSPFGTVPTLISGNTRISLPGSLAGDTLITTTSIANMFGFTLTDWAGYINRYPMIRERVNVVQINVSGIDYGGGSDVIQIP